MCSEHVILMVPRRCVTNVLGLWDCGGALLRSVEEQRSLHFQLTVRRAVPCTSCCCPQLRTPSPCSSTHTITPGRTLSLCGGTLKKHTALSLKLLLVLRVQVRSEAIAPILGGDNASSVLQIRPGAACFAALDVLSVCGRRRRGLMGLAAGASCALLLLPTAVPFSPCDGLGLCT